MRILPAASSLSQLPWVSWLQISGAFWTGRAKHMSTKRKYQRPLRNLQVLLARAAAEVQPGMNIATVKHDDWCPALKSSSMLDCCCAPLIVVEHVG